jgi:hypothetical protein
MGRELATAHSLDLAETARFLAMINVVGADAQSAVMHWKYTFLSPDRVLRDRCDRREHPRI